MTARVLFMFMSAFVLLACACPRDCTPPPETSAPAAWTELFAAEEWNDLPEGQGEIWGGTVRYIPGDGQPSFIMRYNPYRLEDGTGGLTDIYCGSSDELAPFVDSLVEIEGRLETMEVEGRVFVEIWPARIRPVTPGGD